MRVVVAVLLFLSRGWSSRFVLTTAATAAALTMVNLWLTTQWGVGAAVGSTVVATVMGMTFASPLLAGTPLWLGAGYVFPLVATTNPRLLVGLVGSAVTILIAGWLWVRAIRVAAAR